MTSAQRGAIASLIVAVGCAAPVAAPQLPAGIAELQLPADSTTLRLIAVEDDATGGLARRRGILAGLDRQLLMPPPEDAIAPELFDFVVVLAPRMEAGEVSPAWASYLYTTYQRDMRRERPDGRPRRAQAEVAASLAASIAFYQIRANPRAPRPTAESQGFDALREWRTERRIGR